MKRFLDWAANGTPTWSSGKAPSLLYRFDAREGTSSHNHSDPRCNLSIPATFEVLDKIVLRTPWQEEHFGRSFVRDVVVNILGFFAFRNLHCCVAGERQGIAKEIQCIFCRGAGWRNQPRHRADRSLSSRSHLLPFGRHLQHFRGNPWSISLSVDFPPPTSKEKNLNLSLFSTLVEKLAFRAMRSARLRRSPAKISEARDPGHQKSPHSAGQRRHGPVKPDASARVLPRSGTQRYSGATSSSREKPASTGSWNPTISSSDFCNAVRRLNFCPIVLERQVMGISRDA